MLPMTEAAKPLNLKRQIVVRVMRFNWGCS